MPSRHRRVGRRLDRHSSERLALFRNMTMSLVECFGANKEFILTGLAKAKEARKFAERIVTLSIKCRKELDAAAKVIGVNSAEDLQKQHEESKKSYAKTLEGKPAETVKKFHDHMGRSLHLRRLIIERLGSTQIPTYRAFEFRDKAARHERVVEVLIDKVAPRFIARAEENPKNQGGYTRILKTGLWVKGDGSTRVLWGWVGGENRPKDPTATATAGAKATVGAGAR
jgi:ribosomal protein L17